MEVSLAVGTASISYSYFQLMDLESHCDTYSLRKEDLLNIAHNLSNPNAITSLDHDDTKKEISKQLSFISTNLLNYYHQFKNDRSIENVAIFASGCSTLGFFSSSTIITSAMRSGTSMRQLFSIGSGTMTWCGLGFIFHFMMLMSSFYIQDEVKIDQQWLAQLLLCYRSSVIRMALIINNHIQSNNDQQQNNDDIKQLLQDAESLIKKFDEELDPEQIGTWLQYAIQDKPVQQE